MALQLNNNYSTRNNASLLLTDSQPASELYELFTLQSPYHYAFSHMEQQALTEHFYGKSHLSQFSH